MRSVAADEYRNRIEAKTAASRRSVADIGKQSSVRLLQRRKHFVAVAVGMFLMSFKPIEPTHVDRKVRWLERERNSKSSSATRSKISSIDRH